MTGPKPPISPLAKVQGPSINADTTKVYGWRSHGILVVAESDARLSWEEREQIRQLGEKLYGSSPSQEARHG